jgi:hypothetical protein
MDLYLNSAEKGAIFQAPYLLHYFANISRKMKMATVTSRQMMVTFFQNISVVFTLTTLHKYNIIKGRGFATPTNRFT